MSISLPDFALKLHLHNRRETAIITTNWRENSYCLDE